MSVNNIKSTWETINQLLNKKRKTYSLPSHFSCGNNVLNDPYDISCGFNKFFIDVGVSLSKSIQSSSGNPMDYMKGSYSPVLLFSPPNSTEVMEIISDLKDSAAGHDEISASLIKEVSIYIAEPLTHICAKSMETGVVPKGMKIAKVIPLYKSGDPSNFTNYRPISILSCFSKILENESIKEYLSI